MAEPRTLIPGAPVSQRICEGVCLGFAWWTLCSHAVVAADGSLSALIALFLATGTGILVLARRIRRRAAVAGAVSAQSASAEPAASSLDAARTPAWVRRGLPLVAAAAAALAWWWDDPIATWVLLLVALLPAALLLLLREPAPVEAPLRSRAAERGLALLAIACAVYTLVVHRPDADDSFYVDMAIAAIDLPELPLLSRDTLHGRFDLPIHYPTYRLHSWELWNAAVSRVSGIPALYVFHWISAAMAAVLVVLCHALLFRALTPRCWPWTTLALVVVLVAAGETHLWYGNFAFVRIWQGKAICLFVFLPLVQAFAIRFAQGGSAREWVLLAAAQIAALGASTTALWAAPVAALTALACVLRPDRAGIARLGVGALASAYVVAAGLLLKGEMSASMAQPEKVRAAGSLLAAALHAVLGMDRMYPVGLAAAFLAWACWPARSLARRYAIALPLAVFLVLLNPWAEGLVRANVTGPTHWRVMWALPIPILLALMAAAPLARPGAVDRMGPRAACVALLAAFALLVPRYPGWSARNEGAWLGWPSLKVGAGYRWAVALNEAAPRRPVVAPLSISTWIPVSHDHAYPMVVRFYLRPLRDRIGDQEYRDRVLMTRFADGNVENPRAAAVFERGLERNGVQAVCIRNTPDIGVTRDILMRAGFARRISGTDMELWSRDGPPVRAAAHL